MSEFINSQSSLGLVIFCSIESIPSEVFINMTDLIHLDLSNNQLGEYFISSRPTLLALAVFNTRHDDQ